MISDDTTVTGIDDGPVIYKMWDPKEGRLSYAEIADAIHHIQDDLDRIRGGDYDILAADLFREAFEEGDGVRWTAGYWHEDGERYFRISVHPQLPEED